MESPVGSPDEGVDDLGRVAGALAGDPRARQFVEVGNNLDALAKYEEDRDGH